MAKDSETTTSTQTSGLTNPAMNAAATTIGNQLNNALSTGVKADTTNRIPALSGQTMAGIDSLGANPNNAGFGSSISTLLQQQGNLATGNFGSDPYRSRLIDDTATAVNATMQGSGRFGSRSHEGALVDNITTALAPYDYQRQQSAMAALPQLYSASNLPASANLQAGQLMDAYNTARSQEDARIFDATNNSAWNTLQRGGAIFSGTAPVSGTTSTGTQTAPGTPWWQPGAALGLGALSLFG